MRLSSEIPQQQQDQEQSFDLSQFSGSLHTLVSVLLAEGIFKSQQDIADFATILRNAYPTFKGDSATTRFTGDLDAGRALVDAATTARYGRGIDLYNIFSYKKIQPVSIPQLYRLLKPASLPET